MPAWAKKLVTKDDMKNLVTKDDVKDFVTKDDLRKKNLEILEITMGAIGRLEERVSNIEETMATKDDLKDLEGRMDDNHHQLLVLIEQKYHDATSSQHDKNVQFDERLKAVEMKG